ncbi:MAG TPA: hypothetical protein DEB31_11710 [Clostridiales bacterium]|nr:hypothetical protein [Clostridiales bacterium]
MKKKMTVLLASVLLAVFVFAGCGGVAEIRKPAPSEGAAMFTVEGSCEAAVGAGVITVSGTANLMSGTNGVIALMGADGEDLGKVDFVMQAGEAITHEFAVDEGWPQHVYAFITFDTDQAKGQPREVTDVYGKKFENLEGEDVIWDLQGCIVSFMSGMVEINSGN